MSNLPNFTNSTLFPSFADCPLIDAPSSPPNAEEYYLLGTITENMTLAPLTPTFICTDRDGKVFAVTLKLRQEQCGEGPVAVKGEGCFYEGSRGRRVFKKGSTVLVKGARRKGSRVEDVGAGEKEKKGFVEGVWEGKEDWATGICVIPANLEDLMGLSIKGPVRGEGIVCQGCGKREEDGEKMVRCKGCENVWYCGKECQVKGWSENGHKSECKALKAIRQIFT